MKVTHTFTVICEQTRAGGFKVSSPDAPSITAFFPKDAGEKYAVARMLEAILWDIETSGEESPK